VDVAGKPVVPPTPSVEAFVTSASQPASVEVWVERIAAPLLSHIPEIAEDAVLSQSVRAAIRAHWLAFLAALGEPPREVVLVQPAVDLAAELARRRHQLTVLFQVYRLAQQAVWSYITSVVEAQPDRGSDDAEFLMFFWGRASAWLDASVEASVEVFQTERERVLQGAAAQSLDAVRSVLAGATPDPRELSAVLGGHPLSAHNTALLLHADDLERIPDLTEAVTRLSQSLDARNPLVISPGGRDLWCWFATRAAPQLDALRACVPWLADRRITVAVGSPLEGVDGFRLSHLEAQRAQQIAFMANQHRPLTLFPEVELLSVMSSSPEGTQRFVLRTLGGLADDAEGPTRLRQTLHALLSSGSVDEASRRLSVHKNTVRYRVSQAEAMLGSPGSWVASEVELAIRYYDSLLAKPPAS
jgi:hypothetical protein